MVSFEHDFPQQKSLGQILAVSLDFCVPIQGEIYIDAPRDEVRCLGGQGHSWELSGNYIR